MVKKILIIEDSLTTCELLKIDITENLPDIILVFANSYKEAERALRSEREIFHAAIVDLNLPDVKTGEAVKLVNAHKIPIIVFSSSINEQIKKEVYKPEVTNFISKTAEYAPRKIRRALEEVLRRYETTILVVDDSTLARNKIASTLSSMHFNVLVAKDGAEALKLLFSKTHDVNLLITDFIMPDIDGLELTIALREQYDKNELGIIIMSSKGERDTISDFIKMGANDYLVKPFGDDELLTRINSNLELLDLFKKIRDLSNKDYMTGAYNRRYFFDVGGHILEKNKRNNTHVAIATIDIDKFKLINDTYGHDVGDIAIQQIKRILDNTLRSSDLYARFGGEEFCVLIEDISFEQCEFLFEKIRDAFEKNIFSIGNQQELSYTVSIGVFYGMLADIELMLKPSDQALYESKENGRNRVTIYKQE